MTRDEAIKILSKKANLSSSAEEITIDAFVALGILKLDEPKSGLDMLKSRLVGEYGYSHSGLFFSHLDKALKECGLQVVAK